MIKWDLLTNLHYLIANIEPEFIFPQATEHLYGVEELFSSIISGTPG